MTEETDEHRARAVQDRTCWCCKLCWASTKQLAYHLDVMAKRIAEQQAKLKVAS